MATKKAGENSLDDIFYMKEAYKEAELAYNLDEVPIGCIIVKTVGGEECKIIGRGHNRRAIEGNVLRHAELIAIEQACTFIGDWRLEDCRIYVTIEPCPMCAGAMVQARIPVLVYGAANPKAGCAGSIYNLLDEPRFNHRAQVINGVYGEECADLMRRFFRKFR